MTDYDRLQFLFRMEQNSIIEIMNKIYSTDSFMELNLLKEEMHEKIETLARKKEDMLIIDNLNAGGI